MALNFNDVNGSAIKGGDYFKLKDGENRFRIVGGVVPRYLYWVKSGSDNIPFECLSFDRTLEKFTNLEKDWVQELITVPNKDTGAMEPIRCSWAYACLVIDPADSKVKILNLKKKMFEQIIANAKKLGDPTDLDTGYDIVVNRVKTGPHAFNVEYQLDVLEMATGASAKVPVSDELRALLDEADTIDVQVSRDTPAEQKLKLDKILNKGEPAPAAPANTEQDHINDL